MEQYPNSLGRSTYCYAELTASYSILTSTTVEYIEHFKVDHLYYHTV